MRMRSIATTALVTLLLLSGCGDPQPRLPGDGEFRLVNYWAIWCTPCREEIPELNRINERDDVRVLGVNFDRKTGQTLADQVAELGIEFESLDFDPGELLGVPRPGGLPVTVVVSPEGETIAILEGPQTEASLLAALGH